MLDDVSQPSDLLQPESDDLVSNPCNNASPESDCDQSSPSKQTQLTIEDLKKLYHEILTGKVPWKNARSSRSLQSISNALNEFKVKLKDSRTARLWFQYMEMIQVMRSFIWSERTGDWKLSLRSQIQMLPFLAGSGHHLYTKSL